MLYKEPIAIQSLRDSQLVQVEEKLSHMDIQYISLLIAFPDSFLWNL